MESTKTKPENTALQEPEPKTETPLFKAPKKKRKWMKWVVIVGVIVVIVYFVTNILGAGQQMISSAYLNGTAERMDLTVSVSSTGTVTPINDYRVSSLVMGEILEAPFEEGDWVEAGDLLYRFDSQDAQDAIDRAQLALQQAQLSYQSTLNSLQPFATSAGMVQKLHVKVGDTVSAGTVIADITDSATMLIDIPFHSSDANMLYAGQSATVTLEGNMEQLSATIRSISGAEEIGLGNVRLRQVTFEVSNPGALSAGTTATAMVGGVACASSGTFEQNRSYSVMASASGEITSLYVSEGDWVTSGRVLATIGGTNANTTLENARLSVESSQLSLESAQRALDNYIVTAPISGEVIEKQFQAGDKVDSTSLTAANGYLAILYDTSTLTFEMKVDELDINKIQTGQEVSITVDAADGKTYTGYVDKINVNGTTLSGSTTYPITVVIYDPDGLLPGMNVSADIIIEEASQVLCVPVDAVQRGPYVLVAPASAFDANGNLKDLTQAEQRDVTIGRSNDKYIEIISGVEEGEIAIWENQASDLYSMMMGG